MSTARSGDIPSRDEWSFAQFPEERQRYLDDDMPFEDIARRIANLATVVDGCVNPLLEGEVGVPKDTTWRVWFTITVGAEHSDISDRYYGGRDGLRGRYWQSEEAGIAATALSISLLSDKLLQFAATNADKFGASTLARGDTTLVSRSLRGSSAKTWAYEKKLYQNYKERPRLMVARWAKNAPNSEHWPWAPAGPLLDVKGAFFTPDDREYVHPKKGSAPTTSIMMGSPENHAPHYSRKLARVIVLKNGTKLGTLHDARTLVLDVFGSVNARGGALDHTIRKLLAAAESGKRADIADATDSLVRLFQAPCLL
jgi:hypothetical protein